MKFNSQICTSRSQSERLLALGLKRETADCRHWAYTKDSKGNSIPKRNQKWFTRIGIDESAQVCGFMHTTFIPAWSLHRLIEMMPQEIFHEDSTLILGVFGDGVYYADNEYGEVFNSFEGNLYDCVVKSIEWLIKEGYFNTEYLE